MNDDVFMARALDLARSAPFTSPNPRVGAVLVREGRVVSEGAHGGPGTPHAEAVALAGVDAVGGELYVNLEPCNHQGLTPPCAPAVADAGVRRVVVAILDPDERVRGQGVELLRSRGVEVDVGPMSGEAAWLKARYMHNRRTGRAYLSLKLAVTLDGRMAARDRSSRWITGQQARRRVHRRRVEADAILVGSGTVLTDDPALSARDVDAERQPAVIVADRSGRVPPSARIFERGDVIMAAGVNVPHERQLEWKDAGAEVWVLPAGPDGIDIEELLQEAGRRGLVEILCEGGAALATHIVRHRLLDRLELHVGPRMVGSAGVGIGDLAVATLAEAIEFELVESRALGQDVVAIYRRPD